MGNVTVELMEEQYNLTVWGLKVAAEAMLNWGYGTDNKVLAEGVEDQRDKVLRLIKHLRSVLPLVVKDGEVTHYIKAAKNWTDKYPGSILLAPNWTVEDWEVVLKGTGLPVPSEDQRGAIIYILIGGDGAEVICEDPPF